MAAGLPGEALGEDVARPPVCAKPERWTPTSGRRIFTIHVSLLGVLGAHAFGGVNLAVNISGKIVEISRAEALGRREYFGIYFRVFRGQCGSLPAGKDGGDTRSRPTTENKKKIVMTTGAVMRLNCCAGTCSGD
jgi:hypothetical protein